MRLNECSCGCGGPSNGCIEKEKENYMFFGNLETIKSAIDALLEMDPDEVDSILQDGHNWAVDHVATSKDDIQEVADFLINALGKHHNEPEFNEDHDEEEEEDDDDDHKGKVFVRTFESFIHVNEAKKVKAKKKKDQDGDGDTDFADAKIAQYTAGGVDKKKAVAMSRKFNK